jgi:fatty acid desaturase
LTSTAPPPPPVTRDLIPPAELERLNERRDGPGLRQLAFHLAVLLVGGLAWGSVALPLPLRLAGLLLLGAGLAFGFCAMHECGHRTAFQSRWLNDTVAWGAGALSFYNADFYRRYHQWHHRYTHQIGLDPELEDPPPHNLASYLLELSGLPWWIGKIRGHARGLVGAFDGCAYIPEAVAPKVVRSIRLQVGLYVVLAVASIAAGSDALLRFWLLPLAIGQPLLRFVLMAEHGGCPFEPDGLRNTRTTLTLAPLRRLMWNMPFHAEHHLYPSLPFHAAPEAHALLAPQLEHIGVGYLGVHREFRRDLSALALPQAG